MPKDKKSIVKSYFSSKKRKKYPGDLHDPALLQYHKGIPGIKSVYTGLKKKAKKKASSRPYMRITGETQRGLAKALKRR